MRLLKGFGLIVHTTHVVYGALTEDVRFISWCKLQNLCRPPAACVNSSLFPNKREIFNTILLVRLLFLKFWSFEDVSCSNHSSHFL